MVFMVRLNLKVENMNSTETYWQKYLKKGLPPFNAAKHLPFYIDSLGSQIKAGDVVAVSLNNSRMVLGIVCYISQPTKDEFGSMRKGEACYNPPRVGVLPLNAGNYSVRSVFNTSVIKMPYTQEEAIELVSK